MPRLFVGVPIAPDVKRRFPNKDLASLPGKKIPAPNWHLTLKFIGSVADEQIKEISTKLRETAGDSRAFEVEFSSLGSFPKPEKASNIWIGLSQGQEQLIELATAVDLRLQEVGIARELKDFVPHLTIRRIKPPRNVKAKLSRVLVKPVSMTVNQICLYQSFTHQLGAEYKVLETHQLGGE